jgi:hypothetical protein
MKSLLGALLSLSIFLTAPWVRAEDYKVYQEKVQHLNWLGDYSVISFAHRNYLHTPYVLIDKSKGVLYTYSESAMPQEARNITTFPGDELSTGGAGIYFYEGIRDGIHYGRAESDDSTHALFQGDLPATPIGTPVYVLPKSGGHRFRIRNYKLTFNSARVQRNRPAMNYSPIDMSYHASDYSTDLSDDFTKSYVETLQNEKENLMRLLSLENDEYNMLAQFSFGVLAVETNYGKNIKYRIKNKIPYVISIFKGNGLDTSSNSRGPTQIKIIPESVEIAYKLTKRNLSKPENAAVATLAFGAQTLTELRNYAQDFETLTEENLLDYLYYIYNGRRNELKNGTATPQRNLAIQKIHDAIEHLQIDEISN